MTETIIVLSHKESRLEFFLEQRKMHEQKLHWWKHQKPYKQYDPCTIQQKCSDHGAAVAYYDEAIKALKYKEPVKPGRWINGCYGYRNCSECGLEHPDKDEHGYSVADNYCPQCGMPMGGGAE